MALNFTLTLLPGLLFGIIGGKIADIVDRKKILILGDIISGLTTICLFGLHLIEPNISVIIIFVLTFILSAISSFYTPAFTAILPNIVKKDEVVDSNSLLSLFDSIVSLIGPVFATLIIGVMGVAH
ncbi:MFS transporter [Bombilactobacillus thymidiniphilus]|uniref:MFS transporter n=1 Tax=Bombilactobacillus thymidiniphilus TaxID=2923363 RepID=A0ABY4PBZ8_9LACO|nr:MFS transporter [Bombilactobacillus thymidiniphilus]UQS83115.1 MFS transporter [Bombilactobacillus thymidiniphilus]